MAGTQGVGIGAMAMNLANSVLGFFSGGGLAARSGPIESTGTTNDAGDTLRNNAAAVGEDVGGILSSLPGMMNTVVGTFKTDSIGVAAVEQVEVSKVTNVGATAIESVGKYKKIAVGEELVIEVGASKFILRQDGAVIILGTNFNPDDNRLATFPWNSLRGSQPMAETIPQMLCGAASTAAYTCFIRLLSPARGR